MPVATLTKAGVKPVIGILRRNSTAAQRDNYRALEQFDFMDKRVRDLGGEPRFYDEQATSGRVMAKRKVTLAMLDDLRSGKLQGIAFYDVSRATRDPYGVDIAMYRKACNEAGALLITASHVFNFRDSSDSMMFSFEGIIAAREWEETRRRVWTGLLKKAELVGETQEPFFRSTLPPIGFHRRAVRIVDGKPGARILEKDPEQAELMAELERALDRHDTLYSVCRDLNSRGVTPPGRVNGWSAKIIGRILNNPIYFGKWTIGYRDRGSDVWEADWAQGRQLTHELPQLAYWDRARVAYWRRKFVEGKQWHGRERRYTYILSGLLRCPSCGRTQVGGPVWSRARNEAGERTLHLTYRCNGYTWSGSGACPRAITLYENKTLAALRGLLPELLREADLATEMLRQQAKPERSETELQLEHLQREEALISAMIDETLNAAIAEGATISPPAQLAARLARVQIDREKLEAQFAEERIASISRAAALRLHDAYSSRELLIAFDALEPDEQAQLYRTLLEWVAIRPTGTRGQKDKPYSIVAYKSRLHDGPTVLEPEYRLTGLGFA